MIDNKAYGIPEVGVQYSTTAQLGVSPQAASL